MPEEYKDYPRWTCNFCPKKAECEGLRALRGQIICGTCPTALVCVMKDGSGIPDCDEAKRRWQASLPSKCLLAQVVLSKFLNLDKMAQAFITDEVTQPLCPRCLMVVKTRTRHTWNLTISTARRRKTIAGLTCAFCGLDEEIPLP